MSKKFKVDVVTPDATAVSADVTMLQVPAWEGYLGVLASHAPLLAVLKPGVVTLTDDARKRFFAVSGGFLEVVENAAMVLADDFIEAAKIKRSDVERALEEAKQPIGEVPGATQEDRTLAREAIEADRAHKLAWAEARLKALDWHEEAAA